MLYRKAVRAIWSNKRSYIACVFLIGIGIMMFMALNVAGEGLDMAMQKFYRDHRLADVFAKVDAMPKSAADMLSRIEGIEIAEARHVFEARVEVPGSDEIITLRLIGATEDMELNRLLITGSPLTAENDLLVNTSFFSAHGMNEGDPITVFSGGRGFTFYVCGTAMSPEYAYITRGGADLLPDETGFGIGYISADSMGRLTNSTGIANDIVFALEGGYTFEDVKILLEDALSRYGLTALFDREDQLSYAFLKMEVEGLRSIASALPMIFVLMATAVLYLMIKRVIEQDRTQIGTLKALGYSNAKVLLHYLSYGAITGLVGGVIGFAGGYAMSGFYLEMFLQFFLLPEISNTVDPVYIIYAFILAVGGGVAGAFFGALKALRLSPSQAMRPENPKPVKYDIVSSLGFLRFVLTSRGNMALRSITRNWKRSVFVVIGVTFSFGLLTLSGSMDNMVDRLIMAQFTDIQIYGVKLPLIKPVQYDEAIEDAYSIGRVTRAEGLMEMPVQLKHKHLSTDTILMGIEQAAALYRIADTNLGVSYPPPTDGVILSSSIAARLGVGAGDSVAVSSPLLSEDIMIPITRVVEQNIGGGAYMELGALSALFGMPRTATSVVLDTDDLQSLKDHLRGSANIATIEDKDSTLQKYIDMMAMYSSIYLILQLTCVAVAFAIIYNTATISLSERKREYATLRVLGMTLKEVCEIMNFEYWVLTAVAMSLGVPFAVFLNGRMNAMVDMDMMSMPSTLPPNAFLVGVAGCVAAVLLSNFSARRRIKTFDMVEVLKERE